MGAIVKRRAEGESATSARGEGVLRARRFGHLWVPKPTTATSAWRLGGAGGEGRS